MIGRGARPAGECLPVESIERQIACTLAGVTHVITMCGFSHRGCARRAKAWCLLCRADTCLCLSLTLSRSPGKAWCLLIHAEASLCVAIISIFCVVYFALVLPRYQCRQRHCDSLETSHHPPPAHLCIRTHNAPPTPLARSRHPPTHHITGAWPRRCLYPNYECKRRPNS